MKRYGEGDFFDWHFDNSGPSVATRQFIALWYLNEVEEGGSTDFAYFDSVKPETGKLVFFPAGWTHQHRGAPVIKGEKFVITAWLSTKV
jgi:predicted 2-oxoglutarate/Fe(II)-dependent dioxygenase YbiX